MGSSQWLLLIFCCGCVSGLQRWLQLPDNDCQGCNQYYDSNAEFKSMLFVSSNNIILGGKNTLLALEMFTNTQTYYEDDLSTLESSVEGCINEGREEDSCQNYYKVLLKLSDNVIMSCGTWGWSPKCDVRTVSALEFRERAHVRNGNGFCPANPKAPTSYLNLEEGDIGFAGTCKDACTSPAITRFNLQPGSLLGTSHTTNTLDMLSSPSFVYSFEQGNYVYFVFREIATELPTEKIYSRIGRICKNDVGSSNPLMTNAFTSYFKGRFYCTSSQAGQQPFDHDEVYGAVYLDGVLYAAFSGPRNLQTGSILCSFPISVIDKVFDGPYKTFESVEHQWVDTPNQNYDCVTKKQDHKVLDYYLMSESVHNQDPLFSTDTTERLTALTSDSFTMNDDHIRVIYASSDGGRVHRLAFRAELENRVYHTSYKVAAGVGEDDREVIGITYGAGSVYAMGRSWATSIPVKQECGAASCSECLEAHFPYCGWCYDVEIGEWSCSTKPNCSLRNWLAPTDTCRPLPTFYKYPVNVTYHEGATAQFECASHDSEITWSKDGQKLPRKIGFLNPGSIYVPEVKLEDSGYYECSANNTSGVVLQRAYLYVQVPARFIEQPTNITVTYGHQDLVLRCRAVGLPPPEIWWERIDGDLPDGSTQLPEGDLKIIRVMKGDEGAYVCNVKNDVGGTVQSEPAYVSVKEEPDMFSPASEGSSYDSSISTTVLIIGIVISAVVCFVIGLACHIVYRRRKQKSDYIEDSPTHRGTFSQFSGQHFQDDSGYLCPSQSWHNGKWQSFHRHHTGLSHGGFPPDTGLTALMSEEEAPPAYSPGTHPTLSDWYPGSGNSLPSNSRDYAEIMTIPLRPPPMSPPVLPISPLSNSLPLSRDFIPGMLPPAGCLSHVPSRDYDTSQTGTYNTVPVSVAHHHIPEQGQFLPPHLTNNILHHNCSLAGDYSTKLHVSSAI